jgi:hypothetical protein
MKLSEAIREGAAIRPQAFGNYIDITGTGQVCTCALGAAYEVIFGHLPKNDQPGLRQDLIGQCPDTGRLIQMPESIFEISVMQAIVHLNDDEEWTREEIADWLESQNL